MRLQSVEIAARSVFLRALVGIFGHSRPSAALPDWRHGRYRILFIRDDGIGDLILSAAVIRAIAEASPGFSMDVLCSPQNARLARLLPFASEILVHRRGSLIRSQATWRALRRRRYDVVVDGRVALSGVNTQTTALLLSTGSPWRVGIADRLNASVYTLPVHPVRRGHVVDLVAELARPFGIQPESRDWRPRIPLSDAERHTANDTWTRAGADRPRVLVNYSSADPRRRWPAERHVTLMSWLRDRLAAATLVAVGMPSDVAAIRRIAAAGKGVALTPALDALIGLVATADLVISPDTAITHIAAAFERTVVALALPGFELFAPYRTPGAVVLSDDRRTLAALSAERVMAALDDVLPTLAVASA